MGIWDAYPQPSPDVCWLGESGVLALEEGEDWMVDAFRESLRDFVVGVSTGAPLPHSGRSHLASLKVVEAAYASAQDGGTSIALD
jgi:predicted dehydrogenase